MNEIDRAYKFIQSCIAADATLTPLLPGKAWQGAIPPQPNGATPATPYAVYGVQAPALDTLVAGARRAFNRSVYRVLVWAPTAQYSALSSAADELDKALTRKNGPAGTDGNAIACYRTQPIGLDQLIDGVQWSALGGLYRIYIQPADMSLQ